ncbi:acetylornithine deacetylase [Chitinasiproducens palmae]|uniref:Acetylornithine deacetylase n=1 Tax=Chitinasiproducens palmae TaxID=1770053 RepID=A0A1H2PS04_9BURK|nr:acetylornithine deacetylase [Chitinasiproducens palmae]SDV49350.1 acetylornithine deacetylase [Chitinasiproducens palmae]
MFDDQLSPASAAPAAAEPASLDWTRKLVSFDTTSRESNLGLIETVRDHLAGAGIESILSYDADRRKANLFATVPDAGGGTQGGIVLSGHTDVVPVDGQKWDSDPFAPEVRDGKLYGRGTCDMKGFIGSALTALPQIMSTRLSKPVHFAFSYDEEIGCVGAPVMLADLAARGIRPSGCIVGEPTSMRVIVAHKGINAFRCCIRGQAAHSSLTPQGLNAIEYAARLITFIRDIADEFRANGPYDHAFDVPFTTAQTSTIKGGNALNTVPADCEFQFEYRNLPGVDPEAVLTRIREYIDGDLLPRMRREHAIGAVELSKIAAAPSLDASEEAAVTQLVRALTRDTDVRKVAYGTEGGQFQQAGIPSIICGPGNIEQAHRPNEFVSLEQMAECDRFLGRFVDSLAVRD